MAVGQCVVWDGVGVRCVVWDGVYLCVLLDACVCCSGFIPLSHL